MSLFSFSSKKQPEATSVEEALAGAQSLSSAKSKSRKSDKNSSDNEQLVPEKKLARRRLIGAIVMVLAAVIGLPMVLDSEPEAFNKNIAIQIPSDESITSPESKKEVAEEVAQAGSLEQESEASSVPSVAEATKESATARSKSQNENELESAPATTKPKANDIPAKIESTTKNTSESARALAILNNVETNSDSTSTKATTRIVVQVGAFATQAKVNELRNKLTSAGIKSYTQKVATSSGEKIRVRVGPFEDKESAVKVKAQLEKLGINGSLLTL